MKGKRFGKWHRSRVLGAYRRLKSIEKAAATAGVSPSWAYSVLDQADLIAHRTPVYPVSLIQEAERLYVEERLSCRGVAARLAETYDPAPSQEWVYQRLRERGVLRSKSRALRVRNGRENSKDYDALAAEAAKLAANRKLSIRRIAQDLGVSRNMARQAVRKADRCNPSRATRRRAWEADLPDVEDRLDRRARVIYLRRELGKTYAEIAAATGLARSTICVYLKDAGLIGSRSRPRRFRKVPS